MKVVTVARQIKPSGDCADDKSEEHGGEGHERDPPVRKAKEPNPEAHCGVLAMVSEKVLLSGDLPVHRATAEHPDQTAEQPEIQHRQHNEYIERVELGCSRVGSSEALNQLKHGIRTCQDRDG
jgi:hypothetical protein